MMRVLWSFVFLLLSACVTTMDRSDKGGDRETPRRTNQPVSQPPGSVLRTQPQSSGPQYRSVSDGPDATREFQQARLLYNDGNRQEAVAKLNQYLKNYPQGQAVDEAGMLVGKYAYEQGNFDQAAKLFAGVANLNPPSRRRGEALYQEALSYGAQGQRKLALTTLAKVDMREVPTTLRTALFLYWARLASEEGRHLESVLANVKALRESSDQSEQAQLEGQLEMQIQDRLSEGELLLILREYPVAFPAPPVQLRLVTVRLGQGRKPEAESLLQQVVANTPQSNKYHVRARSLLSRINSLGDVASGRIGALLPLSGDQESAGRAVADGLELALSALKTPVEIISADAGSSAESALAAFDRLVFEDKVIAVVGPFSGVQAERVALRASEYGIPYITLSPRPGILEKSNYVFRLALTPERQVRALVEYAWERLNARNFAILFPEDNFGREFATEYFRQVVEKGGTVTAAESYDPQQSDFKVPIENMVGTAFPQFRKAEGEELVKQLEEKLQRKPTKRELESAKVKPIIDFDVLFIPDTFKAVGQIAPSLLYNDVTTQMLGSSTWHNSKILERAGMYLDKALFVDSFATERSNPVTKNFLDQFQAKKGALPNTFAAMGFDVGLAFRELFSRSSPPKTRDELRARLEALGSVEGALGIQVWDRSREVLSEIQLFQIRKGAFYHQGGILTRSGR